VFTAQLKPRPLSLALSKSGHGPCISAAVKGESDSAVGFLGTVSKTVRSCPRAPKKKWSSRQVFAAAPFRLMLR